MANLQVKNVPESIHGRLRRSAKRQGRTVRDLVLEALRRELDDDAFAERLAKREAVDLGGRAATLLEEARAERAKTLPR